MKPQLKMIFVSMLLLTACGGTGSGNPLSPAVLIQSAPLAGPNSAFSRMNLFETSLGSQNFSASVSSFASFKACNDTMSFVDSNGTKLSLGGSDAPAVGRGLLTFSPTATTPMTIGSVAIPVGTILKEINVTFAKVPEVCAGAEYAVQFDDGVNGAISITQNTAFKFIFPVGGTAITSDSQVISLMFGAIVNGMVTLGADLNDSTIQTVDAGQAK